MKFGRIQAAAIVSWAMAVSAQEPATGRTMRVYMIGNSLTDNVRYDGFQRLAESRGWTHVWGRSMTPGAPIFWHWGHEPAFTQRPFGPYRTALVEYEWDAITFQPFQSYKNEFEALLQFVELLRPKNGRTAQLYVYAQWPGRAKGDWDSLFTGAAADDPAQWYSSSGVRAFYDRFVPALRAACPDLKPPRLIPAGHAMYLLNQKCKAGQVPGLGSIRDVYADGIHLNNAGAYIAGLSFFATIYGESPVGLPVEPYQLGEGERGIRLTPELARIIQETVWETVATHPLTGVTSDEPLGVASPILANAVAGKVYDTSLLPAFGRAPHAWSIASGRLPDGLALDAGGRIAGTAAAPGREAFVARVRDAAGAAAERPLAIAVEADSQPAILDEALPAAQQGKFYRHVLRATGGNGVLTWRLARDESAPAGLSLEPDGTLWGAPVKVGPARFKVEALDADRPAPDLANRALTIEVAPADADVLFVRRVEAKAITVDGRLDEAAWQFERGVARVVVGSATGVEAAFDVVAGDSILYVAFRVKDASVNENASEPWNGDSVELFLDTLNNREDVYNFDDRRFVVGPGRGKPHIVGSARGFSAAAQRTDDGYAVEMSIYTDWNFGGKPADRAIGLDVAVNDSADGKTRACRLVWRGTKDNETKPSGFATALLPPAPPVSPKKK